MSLPPLSEPVAAARLRRVAAPPAGRQPPVAYAELHCHTNFSFLDGASDPEALVARASELG